MHTKKLTFLSLLLAIAMSIHFLEALIPPLVPIPGVKLGLANIITLISLNVLSKKDTFILLCIRITLGALLSGTMVSFMYSFAGGLLCFLVEALINNKFPKNQIWIVSVIGAIFHNIGQITIAVFITKTFSILWYIIPLTISAIITGTFIGFLAQFSLSRQDNIIQKITKNI